ncbi:hypothetical protein ACFOD4_04575 [Pseudoroseomonas globiformis]|uniref:Uncharacterized protein n=1 Tax=Teichococcus globiformis TaxID=2307229 RepID=A0ABV7G002_9PROT
MVKLPSLTDFPKQVDWLNAQRCAANLPLLDRQQATRDIIRLWNTMLADAKARLQEKARHDLGRDLAGNSLTHLTLVLDIEQSFRNAVAAMVRRP